MFYGFDIGGSKIALGVYDSERRLVRETRVPTPHDDYSRFLNTLAEMVREADALYGEPGRVGIGTAGLPVSADGTLYAANLPAASGRPLGRDLSTLLEREVRIENDANCFTLSEAWDDEFRRYPLVMGLILGTGVGGGLVMNGRVISGQTGLSGEFGHTRLPVDALTVLGRDIPLLRCGCGQSGCIENYLSGGGFAWLWQYHYGSRLTAPEIVERWQAGDSQAREHVARYLDLLAVCMANLLTVVDPHLVVIGGGLSGFSELVEALPARLPRHLLPAARVPRIERARHGAAGGMRGAAFLHLKE
jgi:N-acetylglucosamine kinase